MLGPEKEGTPLTARPAPAVVAESPVAWSRKRLILDLDKRVRDYNATIQRTLEASKDAPPEPLQPIVEAAATPQIEAAIEAGEPMVAKAIRIWARNYLQTKPAAVDLPQLWQFRHNLAQDLRLFEGAKATRQDIGKYKAQQEVYRRMNDALERRMPGFTKITQREAGLINAREALEQQRRQAAGAPLLPTPRVYGGESGGGGFAALRFGIPMPGQTLAKTALIRGLRLRQPVPMPEAAAPAITPTTLPSPPSFPFPAGVAKVADFRGAPGGLPPLPTRAGTEAPQPAEGLAAMPTREVTAFRKAGMKIEALTPLIDGLTKGKALTEAQRASVKTITGIDPEVATEAQYGEARLKLMKLRNALRGKAKK
jgi:hypothetical protein